MSDLTKRLRSLVTFAHSDFTVAEEAADEIERLQRDNLKHEAALAADHLTIERLTADYISAKDLEELYLSQCECTDEWAAKYRAEIERKADATLLARCAELEVIAANANSKLIGLTKAMDELTAELSDRDETINKLSLYADEGWGRFSALRQQVAEGKFGEQVATKVSDYPEFPNELRKIADDLDSTEYGITTEGVKVRYAASEIERLTMLTNYKQEPLLHSERKP